MLSHAKYITTQSSYKTPQNDFCCQNNRTHTTIHATSTSRSRGESQRILLYPPLSLVLLASAAWKPPQGADQDGQSVHATTQNHTIQRNGEIAPDNTAANTANPERRRAGPAPFEAASPSPTGFSVSALELVNVGAGLAVEPADVSAIGAGVSVSISLETGLTVVAGDRVSPANKGLKVAAMGAVVGSRELGGAVEGPGDVPEGMVVAVDGGGVRLTKGLAVDGRGVGLTEGLGVPAGLPVVRGLAVVSMEAPEGSVDGAAVGSTLPEGTEKSEVDPVSS